METETVTALATIEQLTPLQLFSPGALNPILERIKAEVRAIETDISTEEGRKAISSLAYKIARTKTFIDGQRVLLVAEEKKRLSAIDTEGRRVREELDALKEEVRKPLTDWENAEGARVGEHESRIAEIAAMTRVSHFCIENIETTRRCLDERWNHNFQEFTKRATQAYDSARIHLQGEEKRVHEAEAAQIESARLRAEAEEKARVERETKIAEDARLKTEAEAKRREEAQAKAAKQREDDLAQAAAEEKSRLEREKKESEAKLQKSLDDARAKAQREKLAAEERERKASVHAQAQAAQDRVFWQQKTEADRIAVENRAEAEREAAVKAERRRQEDIRKAEEDQRTAIAVEKLRREADQAHRREIHDEAILALLGQVPGLTNDSARSVIQAIARGLISFVSINY
jgi:hypothetical protein